MAEKWGDDPRGGKTKKREKLADHGVNGGRNMGSKRQGSEGWGKESKRKSLNSQVCTGRRSLGSQESKGQWNGLCLKSKEIYCPLNSKER